MEINPEHPVTQEMRELWYKIVGVLIHKYKLGQVRITNRDIEAFANQFNGKMPCVMIKSSKNEPDLVLDLVDEDRARKMQAGEGYKGFQIVDGQNRGTKNG